MKTIFMCAASTNVGKTISSAYVCHKLVTLGFKVAYCKIIQTGVDASSSFDTETDDAIVKQIVPNVIATTLYKYSIPVAPHLAMLLEGKPELPIIDVVSRISEMQDLLISKKVDYCILESAGGVASPLNSSSVMADIVCELNNVRQHEDKIKPIFIAQSMLGSVSMSLSSISLLQSKGIELSGFCLSPMEVHDKVFEEEKDYVYNGGTYSDLQSVLRDYNVEMVEKLSSVPYIGAIPVFDYRHSTFLGLHRQKHFDIDVLL